MNRKIIIFTLLCLLGGIVYSVRSYDFFKDQESTLTTTQEKSIEPVGYEETEQVVYTSDTPVQEYTSTRANLSWVFPKSMYVREIIITDVPGVISGNIVITDIKSDDAQYPSFVVMYGVPYIDGKGGACLDKEGNGAYTYETIFNQPNISVCDIDNFYSAAYFTHPSGKGEYQFVIGGNGITDVQKEVYKKIFSSTEFVTPDACEYVCPTNGWVNCMPILNEVGKKACSAEALDWYTANCPNFQGAAY